MNNGAGCYAVNGRTEVCDYTTEQVTRAIAIASSFQSVVDESICNSFTIRSIGLLF